MDGGVETRHAFASSPSVPPRSRRLERRLNGTGRVRRSPVPALVVVAALALGGLLWWVASPDSPTAPPAASTSAAASRAVMAATDLVTTAGSTMSSGMAALHTVPTIASVSAVVDPYLGALQQYQVALRGAALEGAAATWRRTVQSQVQQLIGLLGSLNTTAPGQLGNWISGFYLQTAELQNGVEGLESALSAGVGAPTLTDDEAMERALAEAGAALAAGEVPVGAVVLLDGEVAAARHNEREGSGDPTAHAELLVLRDAAALVGGWRLSAVTLVVTLEPCPMCAGALVAARVGRLVYGATDPRGGACGTLYNLCADPRLNHELPITAGVREAECRTLLTSFFSAKRPAAPAPPPSREGRTG